MAGGMSGTHHPQVEVLEVEWSASVDEGVAPLIVELWRAGWYTTQSCQAHFDAGQVWLQFPDPLDAEAFVNAAAPYDPAPGSLWRRAVMWGFGILGAEPIPEQPGEDTTGAWTYHVSVWYGESDDGSAQSCLAINVLFPPADLDVVVEGVRLHNEEVDTTVSAEPDDGPQSDEDASA